MSNTNILETVQLEQSAQSEAIKLAKDLAAWSDKYPRGRVYSTRQQKMDDELIELEDRAKKIVSILDEPNQKHEDNRELFTK